MNYVNIWSLISIHKIESMSTKEIIFFILMTIWTTHTGKIGSIIIARNVKWINEKDQDTPWYNGIALKLKMHIVYRPPMYTNVSPSYNGIVQYSRYGLFSCSLYFVWDDTGFVFHIVRSLQFICIDQMIRDSRARYSVAYRYKFWDLKCFH